jgi:phage tail protein X
MYAASGLLSAPVSALWMLALAAVFSIHCQHLAQGCRECRWFHSTHLAMSVGMLYMFGASAFGWDFISPFVWMALYVLTATAVLVWIGYQLLWRRSLEFLWVLALIQQGAMIYMWAPMNFWIPSLSYSLAVYFALEAIAWPLGLCSEHSLARLGAFIAGSDSGTVAVAGFDRQSTIVENFCMTAMAASMAYMFVGMQLLMSAPPPIAAAQPQQGREAPPIASKELSPPEARLSQTPRAMPHAGPISEAHYYRIAAGDTLARISLRHYGDASKWRDLVKANPGLYPRRLRVGATILLPEGASSVPATRP